MRILQVAQKPQRRGAEIFAYQLSRRLNSLGHAVRIVYLYPHHHTHALPIGPDDHDLQGRENDPLEKLPGFHPLLLYRLLLIINRFQPNIIQVNGARTLKYGAFARHIQRNASWALIYRNIGNPGDWVKGWHYRIFYEKVVMPKLDGVVGVSRATLQNLKNFYELNIPMVHIPRGIDPSDLSSPRSRASVRKKAHVPPNAPVILFVGSLTAEKRLDRYFRVVHQILKHFPELHVWIVGDGPLRLDLEKQCEGMGLPETVHFFGVQEDVAAYMRAADLLLLTSDTEGTPGVILEAGFLGLPVVATRVGGVPECVLDQETGFVLDPDDERGLAQAVILLMENPARRIEMGKTARDWIRANFSMDKIVQRYLDFYQKVLAS